jgi:hypothetical protein
MSLSNAWFHTIKKTGHPKGIKLPEIAPIAKAFRAKKWSD